MNRFYDIPEHPFFDRYLTVKQFAELFDLDPKTVRAWMQQGKLPYLKLGGTRLQLIDLALLVQQMEIKNAKEVNHAISQLHHPNRNS